MVNQNIRERVLQHATQIENVIVQYRRYLHQHPELSFQEYETSKWIQQVLTNLGVPFRAGIAGTGVVATIEGVNPERRLVALRGDMDALPIQEAEGNVACSVHAGVMHACGHDAHTACLLGVAHVLASMKDVFEGTFMLIFQPGEEKFPGGARLMLEEGLFLKREPYCILGAHVLPTMESGHVGFKAGNYMASGDEVYLTVKGQGGHGGMPHTLTDTVLVASHLVVALQQIISRIVPATIPAVLSFGKFIANGATNIIPEAVYLEGTLRTLDENWRATIKQKIHSISTGLAQSMGAECEVKIHDGYPVVYNQPELTEHAMEYARSYLGDGCVEAMDIRMTAEDFGFYSQKYPSVFYRFGVQQQSGETGSLHTPRFQLNESSLVHATGVMAYMALCFMNE